MLYLLTTRLKVKVEMAFIRYGARWTDDSISDLEVHLHCIRKGGSWVNNAGTQCGLGLYEHYKAAMQLLWPDDHWHRWVDDEVRLLAENVISVIIGPADSGKTYIAGGKWALVEYWAAPSDTLVVVSSTDMRGLELRVWGAIKSLFNRALDRFPFLAGRPLESLHCITTDEIDEDQERARTLNRGIVCIPCLQGGRYTGLGKYHGIKAPRLRQVSDESAMMGESHLDSLPNYVGKDYRGVFLGNPLDPLDPLGRIAEPIDGWDSLKEPTKTTKWKTRMLGGECLNLVGTDSPNFDYPRDEPIKFPYLINWKKIDTVREFWGADSQQYYSQCVGVMKTGLLNKRIITRDICKEHHAFDKAIWEGKPTKKIFACDAAYGGVGGDRCVAGHIEFGESDTGIEIIKVNPPQIVPVSVKLTTPSEDQVAAWIKNYLDANGIDPNDGFYDSTGRGTLGIAFAKVFKDRPLVPVEFGGRPSNRPVRHDLFTWELGNEPGERKKKRHVRCDEYYVDFVSELWFSSRYVIECDQLRELPEDVMREGCQREFGKQPTRTGTKLFIESKHDPKARERMRRSPDLYDWLVTAIEGARQRGFKIQKLGGVSSSPNDDYNWLKKQADQHRKLFRSKQLVHS